MNPNNSRVQNESATSPWQMPAKCGCRTLSSEMRKSALSTISSPQIYTSASSQTEMSSTALGKSVNNLIITTHLLFNRISITCACSMHLALFPLDEQTCTLDIASCERLYNSLINLLKIRANKSLSSKMFLKLFYLMKWKSMKIC